MKGFSVKQDNELKKASDTPFFHSLPSMNATFMHVVCLPEGVPGQRIAVSICTICAHNPPDVLPSDIHEIKI